VTTVSFAVMGIDPGAGGGYAVVNDDDMACAYTAPATESDLWHEIRSWVGVKAAFIEQVHAMPGQGVTSMFTFGQNYGALRMALIAASMPFETVTPAKWQRMFSLPTLKACGGSSTKKKNAHKARAQELFPGLKVTHATADALLIAEYGLRTMKERNG